jgi:hypothetical protein
MQEDLVIPVNHNDNMIQRFKDPAKNGQFHPLVLTLTLLFLVFTYSFCISCRSARKIQTAMSKKDTAGKKIASPEIDSAGLKADSSRFINDAFNKVKAHRIDFQTFSAKIKVNYEGGDGRNYDFNAFIRIQKDHVIWVSINALLGIEAFRVIITPDSVKVVDKLEKVVRLRSVSYLQEVAHLPVDFNMLQDLIIGNPVYLDSNIVSYRNDENGLSLMSIGALFKNYITLNGNDYTLKHSKLDDVNVMRARTCDLTYGDYERKDTIAFSTYRKISVAEKSKLDIQLGFKQFNFNETLSFPFSIPKNYKHR